MLYLFLCILLNVSLLVIFSRLNKYEVNLFNVIIINYLICVMTGLVIVGPSSYIQVLSTSPGWLPYCIGLGFCFIGGFYLVGLSSQTKGIAPTSIAQRMSFISSVIFGYLVFSDNLNPLSIVACVLGLMATILIQGRDSSVSKSQNRNDFFMLFGVFVLSSMIEIVIFYLAKKGISPPGNFYSTITIFLSAAIIGWTFWLFYGKPITSKEWVGGVILGLPNFFSIYTLFEALNSNFQGSQIIPWTNLGTLILAFVIGVLLLGERMNKWRSLGAVLAVLSIFLFLL